MQIPSLASLSGLRIGHCRELWCRSRRGSDLALLQLWCRAAAVALIGPLAWEPPYATGAALKRQKDKKKKKKKKKERKEKKKESGVGAFWFHPGPLQAAPTRGRRPPRQPRCYLLVNSVPFFRAIICCQWKPNIQASQRVEGRPGGFMVSLQEHKFCFHAD